MKKNQFIGSKVINSVVQIINDKVEFDHIKPWKITNVEQVKGTGFCVEIDKKRFIVTNAHCVHCTNLLQIRPNGESTKYAAKIRYVMSACDLAIIDVDNENFWEKLTPLVFSYELPSIIETVYVIGYPIGSNNVSFTKGVVSRILDATYETHGYVKNMIIQIDAAINPGNSGGPCLNDQGLVVGIAFQSQNGTENMGQIIPSSIYKNLFLKYFNVYSHHNKYIDISQLCDLGIYIQNLENPDLRSYYHMSDHMNGVLVTHICPLSSSKNIIFPEDIILSFNGTDIQSDGTIILQNNKQIRLNFNYLIINHPPNTPCSLKILRSGQIVDLTVIPKYTKKPIIKNFYHSSPQYFIIAGFVFIIPTANYINQMIDQKQYISPYIRTIVRKSDSDCEDREIIILSTILPDQINVGYSSNDYADYQLHKFNDSIVYNLQQLVQLFDNNQQKYLKFEFINVVDNSRKYIVLDYNNVSIQTKTLLKNNLIPFDRSKNLRQISPTH